MKTVITVDNMRKSDAATITGGTPGIELMYRAGAGICDVLDSKVLINNSSVHIVCGSGNNAGDGYVVALILSEKKIPCVIYTTSEKFSADGKYYYEKCIKSGVEIVDITQKDELYAKLIDARQRIDGNHHIVILDCLLGTGFSGVPREPLASVIEDINKFRSDSSNNTSVVSVDINSGLNGDNGLYEVCVKSDITISIGNIKPGLLLNRAKDVLGQVHNIDIGIKPIAKGYSLFESEDARKCIPTRLNDSNKGTYGYIALIGGSYKYSGAIRLAAYANAAMRSGAGVVLVASPKKVCDIVMTEILESTIFPLSDDEGEVIFCSQELDELMSRVKVIAFGMGIGHTSETEKILQYLLGNYEGTLIIDADGLNCLASFDKSALQNAKSKQIILTPHIKEFSRLTGYDIADIKHNSIEIAKEYSGQNHVITLLKGPTTLITDGEDVIFVSRGCPGMATAGSGDVLSGIMAAVCGINNKRADNILVEANAKSGLHKVELNAVATAAYINGLAGELAQNQYGAISMIAGDTIASIPAAIKEICG